MNRRDLLRTAPVAAIAAALTSGNAAEAAALALGETPVMRLFREWSQLDRDEADAYASDDEAAQDAIMDKKLAIESQMRDAPKVSVVDIALTLTAMTDFGSFIANEQTWRVLRAEARALVA